MPVCLQNARPLGLGARALAGPARRSRLCPAVAPASAAGRAPASNGFCRLKVVAMASKKDKEEAARRALEGALGGKDDMLGKMDEASAQREAQLKRAREKAALDNAGGGGGGKGWGKGGGGGGGGGGGWSDKFDKDGFKDTAITLGGFLAVVFLLVTWKDLLGFGSNIVFDLITLPANIWMLINGKGWAGGAVAAGAAGRAAPITESAKVVAAAKKELADDEYVIRRWAKDDLDKDY